MRGFPHIIMYAVPIGIRSATILKGRGTKIYFMMKILRMRNNYHDINGLKVETFLLCTYYF